MKLLKYTTTLVIAVGIIVPSAAQAYLSPEEVFDIEVQEDVTPAPDEYDVDTYDTGAPSFQAAPDEEPAEIERVLYRGGKRIKINIPTSETEEDPMPLENLEEENVVDEISPAEAASGTDLMEALQEAEADAEVAEEVDAIATTEANVKSSFGSIWLIGFAALICAVAIGAFIFLKKKKRLSVPTPDTQQEEIIPAPPEEQNSSRLQDAIEDIKEEVLHEEEINETKSPEQ